MDTDTPAETTHKKETIIGAVVLLVIVAVITAVVLFIYSRQPNVVYKPAKACDLFTSAEARDLLGDSTIKTSIKDPVISDNTATSTCGYTDGNPDMNKAVVAAINVRSGINDEGVQQNKTEFTVGKPKDVKTVKDLGDSAYFNKKIGQLNILDGRTWVIVSYGLDSTPEANTLNDTVKLAKKVLN